MLVDSFAPADEQGTHDQTKGWSLVGLSVATSVDAFGVGVGLGVTRTPCVHSAALIGIVAGLMTLVGIRLRRELSARLGKRLETVGAMLILLVAVKMIIG